MATSTTWEKSLDNAPAKKLNMDKLKFWIGGLLIFGAIAYLIIMNTFSGAQYFITIDELLSDAKYVGQTVRVSGAVIGKTIVYDDQNLIMDFTIAHINTENENLAYALHVAAADDSTASRIPVHIENQVKPDLLQHEAQAILTGKLGEDGVFYATEILLKCPSRYEDNVPNQAVSGGDL